MATLEDVALISLELSGVTEGERHGTRTWQVAGKTFAWERAFSKADLKRYGDERPPEGPILAVKVEDQGEKEAVLAGPFRGFFTIPHFEGYPAVLVELSQVSTEVLREAILDAWLTCAPPDLAARYVEP